MKKVIIIVSIILGYLLNSTAQQGVRIGDIYVIATEMTESQRNAIASPATDLLIYQTDGTMGLYYYTGTVWTPLHTGSASTQSLSIGDFAHGGIVFYIFQSGDSGYVSGEEHGLICTMYDLSISAEWGCYGTSISGATGTAIGTGAANTTSIVTGCAISGIAAKLCNTYSINYNGTTYNDWYLPSKDELNLMWINLADSDGNGNNTGPSDPNNHGGFNNIVYWSSSESSYSGTGAAWGQNFFNGAQGYSHKFTTYFVRAVRAF